MAQEPAPKAAAPALTPQPMLPKSNGTSANKNNTSTAQKTMVQLKNTNNSDCSSREHSTVPTMAQKLADKQRRQRQQHKTTAPVQNKKSKGGAQKTTLEMAQRCPQHQQHQRPQRSAIKQQYQH